MDQREYRLDDETRKEDSAMGEEKRIPCEQFSGEGEKEIKSWGRRRARIETTSCLQNSVRGDLQNRMLWGG